MFSHTVAQCRRGVDAFFYCFSRATTRILPLAVDPVIAFGLHVRVESMPDLPNTITKRIGCFARIESCEASLSDVTEGRPSDPTQRPKNSLTSHPSAVVGTARRRHRHTDSACAATSHGVRDQNPASGPRRDTVGRTRRCADARWLMLQACFAIIAHGRAALADPDDRALLIPARLSEIETCSTLFHLPRDYPRIEQLSTSM